MSIDLKKYIKLRASPTLGLMELVKELEQRTEEKLQNSIATIQEETRYEFDRMMNEVGKELKEAIEIVNENINKKLSDTKFSELFGKVEMLKGNPGIDGLDADEDEIVERILETVLKEIPQGNPGIDGLDADEDEIVERILETVLKEIPPPIKGDKGDAYILSEQDKQKIASQIDIPIVDRIIEKREIIKEVEKEIILPTFEEIARGIETLEPENKLDYEKGLKNKPRIPKEIKKIPIRGGSGGAGGGMSISIEKLSGTQSGDDVTLDLTQLANPWTLVLGVFQNGQFLTETTKWSRSGNTITVLMASNGDDFYVEYAY